MTVRTRFAPSPTGYMHIGGMRTALFNWLYARHHGGEFILRIDDTDQERNIEAALKPILAAFKWLGLNWDEGPEVGGPHGPYFQSQRGELYQAAVDRLLAAGVAYYCFDTTEEITAERDAAQKEKRTYLNSRRSLDLSAEEIASKRAAGEHAVVRFLVPRDRNISFVDAIRGEVEFDCGLMPDPVIMRANGSPLYNFATVVDDAALKITHVIRAEEHLSNTPVQYLIYEALGESLPTFAHIPYVAAPGSKEKLSKRKLEKYRKNPQFKKMFEAAERAFPEIGLDEQDGLDPVMVEYYEKIGYLPDAVFNALSRLGWSLDDKTEFMSRQTVIENFSLERVVKSPAGLDPDKLDSFQAHWMNELSPAEKLAGCLPYLQLADYLPENMTAEQSAFVARVIEVLGERIKLFSDILNANYFFKEDLDNSDYDEKNFRKRVTKGDTPELLADFCDELVDLQDWTAGNIETALEEFCTKHETGTGQMIPALRLSTTGTASGPGVYETLELLGKDRCERRIDSALSRIAAAE